MNITICEINCSGPFLERNQRWLHAIHDGVAPAESVVGSVSIERDNGVDRWPWINDLFVREDCRRQGVGRLLLKAAVDLTEKMPGAIGCAAGVFRENKASRALFESAGFQYVFDYPDGACLYSLAHRAALLAGASQASQRL